MGAVLAGCTSEPGAPSAATPPPGDSYAPAAVDPSTEEEALAWPAAAGDAASQASRAREAALLAEQDDRLISCLREAGIRVERPEGGGPGWIFDPGGLDEDTFWGIKEGCTQQTGGYPQIIPTTREELSGLYDLHIKTKECLEAQGVTVREPPSREKWIEDSLNNPQGPWLPYESPGAFAYEDVCPDADLYHLYGVDPNNPDFTAPGK